MAKARKAKNTVVRAGGRARGRAEVRAPGDSESRTGKRQGKRLVESRVTRKTKAHVVRDGILAHRDEVRQKGGLAAIALSLIVLTAGLLLIVLPGSFTGLIGFVLTVIALPTLPFFGVPAAGGVTRYALSFISSALLWWVVGHYAARRAVQLTISGWPEWIKEFRPLAIGVVLGSLISLALAAVVLGVI